MKTNTLSKRILSVGMVLGWILGVSVGAWGEGGPAGKEWPCWRGPNHDGTSEETGWVSQWGEDGPKILWRGAVLKGKCWTSPVLTGGKIYVRNAAGDVACVDVRGK